MPKTEISNFFEWLNLSLFLFQSLKKSTSELELNKLTVVQEQRWASKFSTPRLNLATHTHKNFWLRHSLSLTIKWPSLCIQIGCMLSHIAQENLNKIWSGEFLRNMLILLKWLLRGTKWCSTKHLLRLMYLSLISNLNMLGMGYDLFSIKMFDDIIGYKINENVSETMLRKNFKPRRAKAVTHAGWKNPRLLHPISKTSKETIRS